MAKMSLEKQAKKSPIGEALEKGQFTVGSEMRKIVSAKRQTAAGQQSKMDKEEKRQKSQALFKATLRNKGNNSDDDWESVDSIEEDFPVMELEELLDGLKLDEGNDKEDQLPMAGVALSVPNNEEKKNQ